MNIFLIDPLDQGSPDLLGKVLEAIEQLADAYDEFLRIACPVPVPKALAEWADGRENVEIEPLTVDGVVIVDGGEAGTISMYQVGATMYYKIR